LADEDKAVLFWRREDTLRFPALLSERDGARIPAAMKPAEFEVSPIDV
jgi:hypothetical protein